MNKYVVKIVAIQVSTGFVHFPSDAKEAYVICSLHGIADKNTLALAEKVEIKFFDGANSYYQVGSTDQIITGRSTTNEDVAVIIIPRSAVPAEIAEGDLPALIKLNGKEKKCIVRGLPASTENSRIRTLYDGTIVDDKDYDHQVQAIVADALVQHPDADNLVNGYSGSPLLIQVEGHHYCFGVLTDYEEPSKRVMGFTLELLNELLVAAGKKALLLDLVETDEVILSDIEKIRKNTARVLDRARITIGQKHLDRTTVLKEISESIQRKPLTLITGVAGAGKSAATKIALEQMGDRYEIIALQGEQLDKRSVDLIFSESLGVANEFAVLLNSPAMKVRKLLLIDSLEKIYETLHTDVIADFFNLLGQRTDLKIILTCRTYAAYYIQLRYLREFPPASIYQVPLLDDAEFGSILSAHPALEKVASVQSVERILRVPFNLDKATLLEKEQLQQISTEAAFRGLIWRYVIENNDRETSSDVQAQRGLLLEEIALERANKMTSFISFSKEKNEIALKLFGDGILEKSADLNNAYAIAHDIYEDWALSRIIGRHFQTRSLLDPVGTFFFNIGSSPSIRRVYRIWLAEGLVAEENNVESFVLSVFRTPAVGYWKDETLLTVLQPNLFAHYSTKFQEIFFEEKNQILKRCILLLNVACQTPDYELLERLPIEDRRAPYSNYYLIPNGMIWALLLEFVADHIDRLTDEFENIIPVIIQWKKVLRYDSDLPLESKHVGKIILAYFEKYKRDLAADDYSRDRDHFEEMVALFLRLTELFQSDVSEILKTAIAEKTRMGMQHIDDFHDMFLEKALSWLDSRQISKYLPYRVIAAARVEWLYVPPTPEQIAELEEKIPFYAASPLHQHDEAVFGLSSSGKREYFPASAVQTPIHHLLCHHPIIATKFVVELFNHSVDSFWLSDFMVKDSEIFKRDDRVEISYTLEDGTTVTQRGSAILWSIYRGGNIATPNLLQSVLRALEKVMLEMADFVAEDKESKYPRVKEVLFEMTEILLKNSRTVSTTAVVVSVATAHYVLMAKYLLPLLRVKKIFKWDLERFAHERSTETIGGDGVTGRLIFDENKRSNSLPHRKNDLRYVILNLSYTSFRPQIESILDEFYSKNCPDEKWRIMLNSLDYRQLEVIDKVDNGYIVKPKLPPDLQEIVDRDEPQEKAFEKIREGGHWSLKKVKDEKGICVDSEYETWQRYFNISFGDDIKHQYANLFNHPAQFAYLGLKNFFSRMNEREIELSLDRVFSLVNRDLNRSWNPYNFDAKSPFTTFEREAAYLALVEIILSTTGRVQAQAKDFSFWSIVLLNKDLEKEKLIENIRTRLLHLIRPFVAGINEWNRGHQVRMQLQHFLQFSDNWLPEKGFKGLLDSFKILFRKGWKSFRSALRAVMLRRREAKIVEMTSRKVNDDSATINLDQRHDEKTSSYFVVLGLDLIPPDTTDDSLIAYVNWTLEYIFLHIDVEGGWGQDKIHFEHLQHCEKMFALFLLKQPLDKAQLFFDKLIDGFLDREFHSRKLSDFVERTLQEIMSGCGDDDIEQFWFLWGRLYDKVSMSKDKRLLGIVMLDYEYWFSVREDWRPVRGKRDFFEKVVIKENGLVKETAKLLSGLGFPELLPHGINWLWKQISDHGIDDKDEFDYTQKLATEVFYNPRLRVNIQNDATLRNNYVAILDRLIDKSSPSAYLIREDVISFSGVN
ncbi:MAG TPA: hypothetical protein VK658_05025 [Chryseolinea sp.]|nr:hypothetical protein [Chryseolinea sp.]